MFLINDKKEIVMTGDSPVTSDYLIQDNQRLS